MTPEQYRVQRGFWDRKTRYRRGDTYYATALTQGEDVALLLACGLIARVPETDGQGGDRHGGNDSVLPAVRRD